MGRANVLEFFIMERGGNCILINRERTLTHGTSLSSEEIKAAFQKKWPSALKQGDLKDIIENYDVCL